MKYLRLMDANVIVHALVEEDCKNLNPKTIKIKRNSRKIVNRIINGEKVYIAPIQIYDVVNILERLIETNISIRIQRFLLEHPSIRIIETTKKDMKNAHQIVKAYRDNGIGFNDAIVYVIMKKIGLRKYTPLTNILIYFRIFKE